MLIGCLAIKGTSISPLQRLRDHHRRLSEPELGRTIVKKYFLDITGLLHSQTQNGYVAAVQDQASIPAWMEIGS